VVKEKGATSCSRHDYTAWGEPIRTNGFAPDGRWFGAMPETVVAVDGELAEALIPRVRHVIENYRFRSYGDYSAWPGPNSNTFVTGEGNVKAHAFALPWIPFQTPGSPAADRDRQGFSVRWPLDRRDLVRMTFLTDALPRPY
jgi:Protein of unknown function (DUF3750)